ncbi:hypothetical protein VKT23_003422 [Stygiomarasmius scandens]|uniref:Uncharacterized protein n=1 Tax=Marasmiellus scandens TaxID=2682957 RepID=A0ABR1JX55_9AGAR
MSQRRQDRDTIASVASTKATIDKALDLIQQARSKTGPGSGFDLSKVSNGIPMACALIASEILKNGDVQASVAQKASCLQPNHFQHCCNTIRRALDLDGAESSRGKPNQSVWRKLGTLNPPSKEWSKFESYLEKCRNKLKIVLAESKNRYEKVDIECAIFCWVYEIVESQLNLQMLAEQAEAKERYVGKICDLLDKTCQTLRSEIEQDAKSKPKFVLPNPTARRSPNKRPVRELPTRDSPKKAKLSHEGDSPAKGFDVNSSEDSKRVTRGSTASPSKPPAASSSTIKSPSKRVQVEVPTLASTKKRAAGDEWISDVEMAPPETPSKPSRKITTSPVKPAPTASSSGVTLDSLRAQKADAVSPTRPSRSQIRVLSPTPVTPRRKSHAVSEPLVGSSTSPKKLPQSARPQTPSNRMIVDQDDASPSSEDERSEPVQRRFRPVFHDRKQWERRDPRVDAIYKQAEILKKKRVEIYGYPFEGRYQPQMRTV